MAKEESKKFNLKSLSAFNLLLNGVLSVVLIILSLVGSWWYESSLVSPYQPVQLAPGLAKKVQDFQHTNNRLPNNSTEFLSYLKIVKPVFVGTRGAFLIKNYVYFYQKINENMATFWAIPAPKLSQISAETDKELSEKIENIREIERKKAPLYFAVITSKEIKSYQGLSQQKLTDLDLLPSEPTLNQLNQLGLFEKK